MNFNWRGTNQDNAKKTNPFGDYSVYNKTTGRRIFNVVYVAYNLDDLELIFEYLLILIEYLEKKIKFHRKVDFFYWDFSWFKIRSFTMTILKNWSKHDIVSSYEHELMDVVKNLDFLATKYNAYHLAYPRVIANTKKEKNHDTETPNDTDAK